MKIAVTDANIFIDLIYLEIELLLVNLNLKFYTTQFVIDELDENQQARLGTLKINGALIIYSFNDAELTEFSDFTVKRSLSIADHSVLFIAGKLKAIVLSGDSVVRKTCKELKLQVHGILWLLDECIATKGLSYRQAHKKLSDLILFNNRLPEKDCLVRLVNWEKQF